MTTALTALREEIKKHSPSSELVKLLSCAELHIGNQLSRIHELEEEAKQLREETGRLRVSVMTIMGVMSSMKKYIDPESLVFDTDQLAQDYTPWVNIMGANGMKPDGAPLNQIPRPQK